MSERDQLIETAARAIQAWEHKHGLRRTPGLVLDDDRAVAAAVIDALGIEQVGWMLDGGRNIYTDEPPPSIATVPVFSLTCLRASA